MTIIHFSDSHLGYNNYDVFNLTGTNEREQDFYNAFELVINDIIEKKPDFVIHTGDFFHRPSPTNRAIEFAVKQLNRLSVEKIPTIIIAGNHSTPKTFHTSPILKVFEHLDYIYLIFNQEYQNIRFDKIDFHCLPHINEEGRFMEEYLKIKPTNQYNFLLMHTSIGKKYLEDMYGESIFPSKEIESLNRFDYVALGHWHNFQSVKAVKNAWYSGSTERMSESEILQPKGYCEIKIEDNQVLQPQFIEIQTRPWVKLEINNCNEKPIEVILQEMDAFKTNNIKGAILSIYLNHIKNEQSMELTNRKIKEIFNDCIEVLISRKNYFPENSITPFNASNTQNFQAIFEKFIHGKYEKEEADRLLKLAMKYFDESSVIA